MKNLKLSSTLTFTLDLLSDDEQILLSAFDIEHNRIFFASSANLIYILPLSQSQSQKPTPWGNAYTPSDAEMIELEPGDCIVAIEYLIEKEALVVGTSGGSLVLYSVESGTSEVVGRVEGGVKSMGCSPDGSLLAVTAGLGQLLVITDEWDVLYETLVEEQLSHTVEGDNLDGSSYSQSLTPICWRGDGKYFATLGGLKNSSLQKLRIWDRESGLLHSTSESKSFMGAALDWMPSGAKVAAAYDRKTERKCPLIVFFEKNGLERSSFTIDEPVETVIELLKWNCNSDLLAAAVSCDDYDAIKIWYFSNNKWYLKQEMRYSKKDRVKFIWDPTKPLHLICWTESGKIRIYSFVWQSAVTETSTGLVIDNCNVLVSPLAMSLMPPPMSLFNLKFHAAVQNLSFLSKNSKIHLAACLSDGSLCVIELPRTDIWEDFENKEFGIDACRSDSLLENLMHLTWLDSHILLGVSCNQTEVTYPQSKNGGGYYLYEIELVCSVDSVSDSVNSTGWQAKILKSLPLEVPIIGIVPNPAKKGSAFIQMDGGSVVEYSSNMSALRVATGSHAHDIDSENGFTSSCPWMKAVLVSDNGTMKPLLIGLDDQGRLQIGKKILCNSCSSFSFYANTFEIGQEAVSHLLLTTKQDLLFIICINDILHGNLEMKAESSNGILSHGEENKDFVNIWEKGAKLVGVIHGDEAAAILQTTRGNLECIYPRRLVLMAIANALLRERYRAAMLMVRRHRIDFNIIIDYCGWQDFLKLAPEFVRQVNNLSYITEFVCSLKNENVTNTLYKNYVSLPVRAATSTGHSESSSGSNSKVTLVLQAVRIALEQEVQASPARELCILTTLARSEPPALEEALNRIKTIREMELLGTDDANRKLNPSAEDSLKHLLWLTDTNAVYETALGLYDLNLAAIVALNSQKDPKEFIPFLKGLENLPPVVMRYTVDLKLGRYASALKHMASAGEDYFEDCIKLMMSNTELFPLGLQLFTDIVKRRHVQDAWGDHLHDEKCFEDAAMTYLCCSSYQKALKAYRACGNWKGVFTVAGLLGLKTEEVLQLAFEICEEVQALGKPAEAGKIALDYCADVAKGVGCFIAAREWEEALRVAYKHERVDLVSEVKDAAFECANTLIVEYKDATEKVGKYMARYLAVRQKRLVLAAKIQNEERFINDPDYDSVSEVSSAFSKMSAYTTSRTVKDSRSSAISSSGSKARDRRSQRKKGGKIRAGSPGEEMALVDHLKAMHLTDSAQHELKSLVIVLVMLGNEEGARQVQRAAGTFQLSQQAAVKLCEDTIDSEILNENTQTLDHYLKTVMDSSQVLPWQSKVLLPL